MELPSWIPIELLKPARLEFNDKILGADPLSLLNDGESSVSKIHAFEARARSWHSRYSVSFLEELKEILGCAGFSQYGVQLVLSLFNRRSLGFRSLLPIGEFCLGQKESVFPILISAHVLPAPTSLGYFLSLEQLGCRNYVTALAQTSQEGRSGHERKTENEF